MSAAKRRAGMDQSPEFDAPDSVKRRRKNDVSLLGKPPHLPCIVIGHLPAYCSVGFISEPEPSRSLRKSRGICVHELDMSGPALLLFSMVVGSCPCSELKPLQPSMPLLTLHPAYLLHKRRQQLILGPQPQDTHYPERETITTTTEIGLKLIRQLKNSKDKT